MVAMLSSARPKSGWVSMPPLAMAEEMPAGDAGDRQGLLAAGMVEDHGESSGLAGKDDRTPRHGIEGDVMAAIRQIDHVQDLAGLGQHGGAKTAVALDESRGEDG